MDQLFELFWHKFQYISRFIVLSITKHYTKLENSDAKYPTNDIIANLAILWFCTKTYEPISMRKYRSSQRELNSLFGELFCFFLNTFSIPFWLLKPLVTFKMVKEQINNQNSTRFTVAIGCMFEKYKTICIIFATSIFWPWK